MTFAAPVWDPTWQGGMSLKARLGMLFAAKLGMLFAAKCLFAAQLGIEEICHLMRHLSQQPGLLHELMSLYCTNPVIWLIMTCCVCHLHS